MNTRKKNNPLPPGLVKQTRSQITTSKKAKEEEAAAERQRKQDAKDEEEAKQSAAKKRVSQFEDKHAVQQAARQTLRPDKIPLPSLPTQQSSLATAASTIDARVVPLPAAAIVTATVISSPTPAAEADPTIPEANTTTEVDEYLPDDDSSLLPMDDVNAPPTSESERGFALGELDNSSTDAFSLRSNNEDEQDDEGEGGAASHAGDGLDDFDVSMDPFSSSDEYEDDEGQDDEEEDEDEDFDAPFVGKKRKNASSNNGVQQTKKARQKSKSAGLDSDGDDDSLFAKFLEYKKAVKDKAKKAEKAKKKRENSKAQKSAIRESTQSLRQIQPDKPTVAPAPKSKVVKDHESTTKKSKGIGGITKGWRKNVYTMPGAAASSTASLPKAAHTSGDEQEPGAFDQDESKQSQAAARLAGGGRRLKQEDDVVLVPADVAEIDGRERGSVPTTRKTFAKRDLPITTTALVVNWDKDLVPFILAWVGTLDDPFSANAHPDLRSKVSDRWRLVLPKLPSIVEYNGKPINRHEHPALFSVAFQAVRTWRSEIGKNAFEYLSSLWDYELMAKNWGTIELRRDYIALYLTKNNFAYEDFSDDKRTGSFRGAFLLQSFCYHVRILVRVVGKNLAQRLDYFEKHGYPVGAMAVCFVAVKRSLKLWENGYLIDDDAAHSSKKRGQGGKTSNKPKTTPTGFNNDPWGVEARVKVVPLVKQLKSHQWADIFQRCEAMLASEGQLDDEDDGQASGGGGGDVDGGDDEPEMIISD